MMERRRRESSLFRFLWQLCKRMFVSRVSWRGRAGAPEKRRRRRKREERDKETEKVPDLLGRQVEQITERRQSPSNEL